MTGSAEGRAASGATRGSAIKLTAELLGRGMSLVTFLLLARSLGVADYGAFTTLSVWAVMLAESGELGIQGLASQALVTRELSLAAMVRAKALAAVLGLVCGLLSVLVSRTLGILILFFLLAGWSEFAGVALRARGRATSEAWVILCLRASGLAFVGGFLLSGRLSLEGVGWAHVASTLPALALGAWLLRGEMEDAPIARDAPIAVLRRSAPLAVNGGLALVSLRVELLALERLRGAHAAGIFGVALRVVEFLSMVPSAIAGGAMPGLAREANSESDAVRRRTAWSVALLAGAASLGLAIVAPGVVRLVGGDEFLAASQPMRLLALAVVPLFANVLLSSALVAAGRPDRLPRLTALRVGIALILALVLAPRFGPMGAAAGFLVSEVVLLVVALRACRDVRFPVAVAVPFGAGVGLAVPMAIAVSLLGENLAVQICGGIVTWALTLTVAWAFLRRSARNLDRADESAGP